MTDSTEREAFEAWVATQPRHEGVNMRFLALQNAYIDFDLHGAWLAWQARASLAQAPQPQQAPLREEQILAIYGSVEKESMGSYLIGVARAIELAHGIGSRRKATKEQE